MSFSSNKLDINRRVRVYIFFQVINLLHFGKLKKKKKEGRKEGREEGPNNGDIHGKDV